MKKIQDISLIEQGAKLVTDWTEIVEEYKF